LVALVREAILCAECTIGKILFAVYQEYNPPIDENPSANRHSRNDYLQWLIFAEIHSRLTDFRN
jgi:hypothetical protein